jgi:Phage T7 capsid assembly protein
LDLSTLNDAQKAALAKAEASGVEMIQDGKPVANAPPVDANITATATAEAAAAADAATAAAAAAAAAATTAQPAKATKPAGVPDKFWNAEAGVVNYEAWSKSTAELERSFSQQKAAEAKAASDAAAAKAATPEGAADPATMAAAVAAKAAADAAAEAAKSPAITPEAIASARAEAGKDFAANGKLSDASYDNLAKVGIDRAMVDTYMAGEQAKVTLYMNSLHDAAGGKDEYTKMLKWAPTSYSDAEVTAFDAAIRSGDPGQMKMAVGGLKARYAAEFGKGATTTVTPNNADIQAGQVGFKTQSEMTSAMKDPKWSTDANYRREVTQKIEAGLRAGNDLGINIHGSR